MFSECKPEPTEAESKYHSADYNCNSCDERDCYYWEEFHNPELQAEMDEDKLWAL